MHSVECAVVSKTALMKPRHQDNIITLAIHDYARYKYCVSSNALYLLFDQIVLTCKSKKNTVAILLGLASYISHSPDMFVSYTYQKYRKKLTEL